ncbi:MaoC/PaaZ C-terminal domain-containing protein [Peribacillus kribbensis]|uniref:MaoC/PaaZ C-terminal domain-containing protein n=1 Tax=Peribacillus kribbensis TaxID=356658 RepID=UPI0003FB0B62|nr:MaoC/PaaZ C-terminal domain-containing protein [Peribacillus kribbensis]
MMIADLEIGKSLPEIRLAPVSRIDLIKYAGASGDYNPIHTIDEEAKKSGLPGVIAHGMWTMGNLSKLFTPLYEQGFIEDYQIRFKDMVFLNDILTLKAVLSDRDNHRYFFKTAALNQNGKEVIKGDIIFLQYA